MCIILLNVTGLGLDISRRSSMKIAGPWQNNVWETLITYRQKQYEFVQVDNNYICNQDQRHQYVVDWLQHW